MKTTRLLLAMSLVAVAASASPAAEEQNGMILVPAQKVMLGTTPSQRQDLAKRFDCHPTWLNDDLPAHEASLKSFWMDRHPVTNARYLAFTDATGYARPAWWKRWDGTFPAEYADHPVTGICAKDALAYAHWAGKRLPTAEEWEAAAASPGPGVFPWGDAWPGPIKLRPLTNVVWDLPGTRPVGSGDCGRSPAGLEDFAGQVSEWVSDVDQYHGSHFYRMKGASWFHEDPVNFRTASGWFATEVWLSSFSGFRCALDGGLPPPPVAQSSRNPVRTDSTRSPSDSSPQAVRTDSTRSPSNSITTQAGVESAPANSMSGNTAGRPSLQSVGTGGSRHVSINAPGFDLGSIELMAPETILWNHQSALSWRDKPDLVWQERTPQRSVYELKLPMLRMHAEFTVADHCVEQRFTVTNLTDQPGAFNTSTCFKLQNLAMFYDCEQLRTYALAANDRFIPVRRLARAGDHVRWITHFSGPELGGTPAVSRGGVPAERRSSEPESGGNPVAAILAVVSRDGRRIIAAGRAGAGKDFTIGSNSLFTCLHSDSTSTVNPGAAVASIERFWFVEGTLDDLLKQIHQDYPASAAR